MKKFILPLLTVATLVSVEAEAGKKWGDIRKKVSNEVVKPLKKNIKHQVHDEGSTTQTAVAAVTQAASDVTHNVKHQVNDSDSTTHRVVRDFKDNIKHQLDDKDSTLNRVLKDLSHNFAHQISDEGSTLNEALEKFEKEADQLVASVRDQFDENDTIDNLTFCDIEAAVKQAVRNVKYQLLDESSSTRKTIDRLLSGEHDEDLTLEEVVENALAEEAARIAGQ